jgi:hypothetical protein
MTLTRLLEINLRLLKPGELVSIQVAERIWKNYGSPTRVRELTDILEKVLSECGKDGIWYAPILLQRKKALHRGTWAPRVEYVAAVSGPTKVANANGGLCSKCGGSGYVSVRGGRGMTLCPCEAWKTKRGGCN